MSEAEPGLERVGEYWDWIAVSLFLLVTVDMLTTMFAAAELGPAAEANPIMRWALAQGTWTLVAVNLAVVVLAVSFFYGLVEMLKRSPPRVRRPFAIAVEVWLGLLVFAGLLILANNLAAIVLGSSLL